jgi:hypothetical protein
MTKGDTPMMTMQNKTLGQQFLEVLNAAKNDKEKMFTLLRSTLEKVNPFPSEGINFPATVKQITDIDSIASMRAAKAGFNASHGAYMFAEDYIYLTAKAYKEQGLGNITDFKKDFRMFTDKPVNIISKDKQYN